MEIRIGADSEAPAKNKYDGTGKRNYIIYTEGYSKHIQMREKKGI